MNTAITEPVAAAASQAASDTQRVRAMLQFAMARPDTVVVGCDYPSHGRISHRIISPTRFLGHDSVRAYCLTRGDYRTFSLAKLANVQLGLAVDQIVQI